MNDYFDVARTRPKKKKAFQTFRADWDVAVLLAQLVTCRFNKSLIINETLRRYGAVLVTDLASESYNRAATFARSSSRPNAPKIETEARTAPQAPKGQKGQTFRADWDVKVLLAQIVTCKFNKSMVINMALRRYMAKVVTDLASESFNRAAIFARSSSQPNAPKIETEAQTAPQAPTPSAIISQRGQTVNHVSPTRTPVHTPTEKREPSQPSNPPLPGSVAARIAYMAEKLAPKAPTEKRDPSQPFNPVMPGSVAASIAYMAEKLAPKPAVGGAKR
jgi:hypothetical protein